MTFMQSPLGLDRPDSALLRPSGTGRGSLRRVRYGALAIAIIGATGLLFLYLPGHPPPRPALAAPALTVTTAAPHVATWATTVSATGGIFPWQEASAGTQIGSYQIIDVQANVGDQVRKGQVLARLNPALLQAEEAQLVAGHDQAEANRQRALSLQGSGGISDQDVLQLVTQAKTSAAQLAAKRLQLRYTTVTAPDDGVVSARTAALGAVVPAGQELFRIIRHNRLEWRGELTAAQIASIAPGQPISLTLPDGSQTLARTRITGPALDGQSRLGLVYADIVPGGRARAGMYASGRISIGQRPALAVPAASVVVRDGRSYVFRLVDGSGASSPVRAQAVTVGRRLGDEVEIVEGLSGAEKLVVEGAGFLGDGDVVRIQASQPGQSGAARP